MERQCHPQTPSTGAQLGMSMDSDGLVQGVGEGNHLGRLGIAHRVNDAIVCRYHYVCPWVAEVVGMWEVCVTGYRGGGLLCLF